MKLYIFFNKTYEFPPLFAVPSPHMTKALVEKLNLRRPQSFSIQTVGENGRVSRLTDAVMFEDVLSEGDSTVGDGDMSSVMSSCTTDADRRVVRISDELLTYY